ncbi:MAG: ABC-ATPase domain-containing protein, partial [Myxococcota bacterium]
MNRLSLMPTETLQDGESLRSRLRVLDGQSYRAYKEIRGGYAFDRCAIYIDHVQGDPFAAPSKLRVRVARNPAQIPDALFDNPVRRLALEDFLARCVRDAIGETRQRSHPPRERRGSGGSGAISIDAGGQQILQRTAAVVTPDWIEARMEVGLPAAGRRILGRAAQELLCDALPQIADQGLAQLSLVSARRFVDCVENQEDIRDRLSELGLIAFVADGSVLPRENGASDRPLLGAVPFESPRSLRIEIPLLHPIEINNHERKTLCGLGVRRGVTLIVGGGYHGKSTLLRAIERGVYPHIPGDGREWVVSDRTLVKIRAEDGRRVERVDIDGFVSGLPGGRSTHHFDSDDASGSTSQAANIMESLEVGATGLLLDEDTSATNFMVR